MSEFQAFSKIARLNRECIITEKLDGTNAAVVISEDGGSIGAQSRSRIITQADDNYGFARWVSDHRNELLTLGPGYHFGEWWGAGIQRRYGLAEKRFSLFNVSRWADDAVRPACCHVVPVLYQGLFSTEAVGTQIERLRTLGSVAAPGFDKPEGVVVFHTANQALFKVTLEKDEQRKSQSV